MGDSRLYGREVGTRCRIQLTIATPRCCRPGARGVSTLVRDVDFTEDAGQGTPI